MSLTITSQLTASNGLTTGSTHVDLSVNVDNIQNGYVEYTLRCYKSATHKADGYDAFTPVLIQDGKIYKKVQKIKINLDENQIINFNLQTAHQIIHDYLEEELSWQVTINPLT